MGRCVFWVACLAVLLGGPLSLFGCGGAEADRKIALAIKKQVARPFRWFRRPTIDDDDIQPLVRSFYRERSYRPAWTHMTGPTDDTRDLVKEIAGAADHGLRPEDYDLAKLERMIEKLGPLALAAPTRATELAALDVELTRGFLKLAMHRAVGQVNPLQLPAEWHIRPRKVEVVPVLVEAVTRHRVRDALEQLDPRDPQYVRLRDALARYRAIERKGGASAGAMVGQRIRQIELNMERRRWVPDSLRAGRYLEVDIPAFRLDVMENQRPVLSMRVVVGKQFSPTPVFADRISHLVFNPYWNVPVKIAREEILPGLWADPGYLAREGLRLFEGEGPDAREVDPTGIEWASVSPEDFRFSVRADPGPQNPLGKVKFMCPNQFDVYLHDTPADHLFDHNERGFSHGCIRVEKPLELAEYLLRGKPGWGVGRITAAFDSSHDATVTLPEPIPVHIVYWTAFVDDRGRVEFRDDVYRLDFLLDRTLRSRRPSI